MEERNYENQSHPEFPPGEVSDQGKYSDKIKIVPIKEHARDSKVPASAWKTLVILSSIATMVMYTETMLVPSLPNIIREFALPYSVSPWILTTYLVVGAVMTPVASSLAEIHGKKKVLLAIMMVYSAGVLAGGLSTDFFGFVLARAMQGVGMAMFPIAFSIIREQFPKSRLAIGQGIITSMFASGSILGLIVGAAIAESAGWKMTFLSILPIAILLPVIVWRFTKIGAVHSDWNIQQAAIRPQDPKNKENADPQDTKKQKQHLDILGAITLAITITLFLIVLTLIESSTTNARSFSELVLLAVGCTLAFAGFIVVERRAKNPIINASLLRNRILLFTNSMMIILGFSMFMVFQTIPILAESPSPVGFGAGITGAAQIQLPFSIILLVFGPTSGYIVSKLGSIRPAILGYLVNALGFFIIAAFHSQPWMISVGLATISTGLSLGSVGIMNIVLLATPQKNMVTSVGMTSLLRIVGSSIGPAVSGVLMQIHQVSLSGHAGTFPSSESYTTIFLIAAVMSVISVLMALKIKQEVSDKRKNQTDQLLAARSGKSAGREEI
jgi:MFS family permease